MTHRFASIVPCVALAVLAAGCDPTAGTTLRGPSPDGGGSLSLAVGSGFVPGSTYFQVRLYKTVPASLAEKAYFMSPCTPPNLGFTVTDLDVADGYVVVYDAFSTVACDPQSLIARGIRGEVEVTREGTGAAVYFIQVNPLGQVAAFPMPPAQLANSGISCDVDVDCQGVVDCPDPTQCQDPFQVDCQAVDEACVDGRKWVQYRVHPAARCETGTCRLSSLFPLNVREHRAWHVAASAADGDVVIVGGFSQSGGTGLTTNQVVDTEAYDSDTGLFRAQELGADLGTATGLMGMGLMEGGLMVLVGGSPTVGAEVDGDTTIPMPRPEQCSGGTCTVVLSPYAFAVDLAAGTARRTELGFATAGALVTGIEGPAVHVRTGLVKETADRVQAGTASYRCTVDADGLMACETVDGSDGMAPRFLATSACLARSAAGCTDVVVLGGNARTAPFGEWYSTAKGKVANLAPAGGVPETLFGAEAVVAGGQVWTFGGGSAKVPDAQPVAYNIDPDSGTITGTPMTLEGTEKALMLRMFHRATPLADGKSVLLTGGIGPTMAPLASAVLVEVSGGQMTVKSVLKDLSEARLQHQATLIRGGLMDGAVLLTGGLSGVKGALKFAGGAEIFVP